MDEPDLDPASHRQALEGLRRLNLLSGSARILWPGLRSLALSRPDRRLSVLDVACGGGDVALALSRRAQRAAVELELLGLDKSPVAIECARKNAARANASLRFEVGDVLAGSLPSGFDAVVSSLFLHHLDEEQAAGLLGRMAEAAERLVLVNDLRRSRAGYWLAQAFCHLVTTSHVVHVDGPRSVSAAWTMAEAAALCRRAGLKGAVIERRWPFRFLLSWRRCD